MTTAGPNYAGTIASDSAVGSIAWSNISNMGAADTNYATVAPGSSGTYTSYYAKLTNFGFSLPSNATVDGITVETNRRCDQNGATRYALDAHVKLIKAGTIGATNKADTTNKWPTTLTVKSYGGAADLWSDSWAYSDINNSGFGVAFSCAVTRAAQSATAYVDYVRVTVTYTVGGTTYTQSVSGSLTPTGTLKIEVRKTTLAGSMSGVGALNRSVGRGVSGAVNSSGALLRGVRKDLSGTVGTSGVLIVARTILLNLAGSVVAAGSLARRVGRSVGGSVVSAGMLGRVARKGLSGGSGAQGVLSRRMSKGLSGESSASGNLTRQNRKEVSGSLSASGLIARLTRRNVTGTVTGAGTITRTTRKGLSGSLTASGIVTAIRSAGVFFVNLAGSLTASGALGRATRKSVAGQSTPTGTLFKSARKGLIGSVAVNGVLTWLRSVLLSIGGSLTPTGSVTKRASIEQTGTVQSSGGIVKRISKSLAGILAPIASLIARLAGGAKRGVVHVGDRAVNGLMLAAGLRWMVDIDDDAAGRVALDAGPVSAVATVARPVYGVMVGDLGGLTA